MTSPPACLGRTRAETTMRAAAGRRTETVRCCRGEALATTATDIKAAARPTASRRRSMISPHIGNDSYRIRQASWPMPAIVPVTAAGAP